MTLQTFVPYIPFLALSYALFALIQALRHQRQGVVALLLALIGIAAPLVAYVLNSDIAISASLIDAIFTNSVIVFVASLLTLWIERRNQTRDPKHSYGMVGIGLSILLMISMFALPLVSPTTSSAAPPTAFSDTAGTTTTTSTNNGDFVLVSANQSSGALDQTADVAATAPLTAQTEDGAQPQMTGAVSPAAFPTNTPAAPIQSETPVETTETSSDSTVRPTPISFAQAQPTLTPEVAETAADVETSSSDASTTATCSLMVDYNLNLRDQPTTEGSAVYLSIPFGTAVTAEANTNDGWYKVSYAGYTGWISGDYVTVQTSCAALPN